MMTTQRIVVAVSCLLLLPAAGSAQTLSTGAIGGLVTDATGAVLPGVTVEAASPALIEKVRTATTDGNGRYLIVNLTPGVYTVTLTLPGFSRFQRQGLTLTAAFTATVDAQLAVGSVEDSVTVTGESPVVDLQNVTRRTTYSSEVVEALPVSARTVRYAVLMPGAVLADTSRQDVGGNQGESSGAFGIHGARTQDFTNFRDGGSVASLGGAGNWVSSVNPSAAQEIVVSPGGVGAESETGGIQMNVISREGGNVFSGIAQGDYGHKNLVGTNVTPELTARGVPVVPDVRRLNDYSGGVGGPIKRDRLWFYLAGRRWGTSYEVPGLFYNKREFVDTVFYEPDLSRPAFTNDYYNEASLRLTWQINPQNKLSVSDINMGSCNCFWAIASADAAPENTGDDIYWPNNFSNATWTYVPNNRLLVEAGAAFMNLTIRRRTTGGSFEAQAIRDRSRGFWYGAAGEDYGITNSWGPQAWMQFNERASVSYVAGSHAFKAGLWMQQGEEIRDAFFSPTQTSYVFNGSLAPGREFPGYRTAVPEQVIFWAVPYVRHTEVRTVALWAQDQWTRGRLTLNLGVRFDHSRGYSPATSLPAGLWVPAREFPRVDNTPNWKDVSPRLGVAYNLFGDGRTAVKATLSRYVAWQSAAGIISANNPVNLMVSSATRTWNA